MNLSNASTVSNYRCGNCKQNLCKAVRGGPFLPTTEFFPKIDHSANVARVEFFLRFAKDLAKISQGLGKIILNAW